MTDAELELEVEGLLNAAAQADLAAAVKMDEAKQGHRVPAMIDPERKSHAWEEE